MQFDTCGVRRPALVASSGYGASSATAMYDRSLHCRHPGAAAAVAYHERLVGMIFAEEAKLIGHLSIVVHDLKRRIRVRKAKGKW